MRACHDYLSLSYSYTFVQRIFSFVHVAQIHILLLRDSLLLQFCILFFLSKIHFFYILFSSFISLHELREPFGSSVYTMCGGREVVYTCTGTRSQHRGQSNCMRMNILLVGIVWSRIKMKLQMKYHVKHTDE